MLDGRVKTLHPRISAGVLADLRAPDHREQLAAQLIEPFELVVVNLYPFAQAAARTGIDRGRADRADRHRRADSRSRGGQEPRERWHRHRPSAVRRGAARAGPRQGADDRHAARAGGGRLPADCRLRRDDLGGAQRRWWARRPTHSEEAPQTPLTATSCHRRSASSWSECNHCATARTLIRPRLCTEFPVPTWRPEHFRTAR